MSRGDYMPTVRNIGFENSNSKLKGISDSKKISYLNTIRKVRSISSHNIATAPDFYEVNGSMYQVGFDAGYGSGSKDESRYYSEQFRIESAIAFSQMCNNGNSLNIVTGLPAHLANKDDLVHKLKCNLIGKYHVKHKNAKKDFFVDRVSVVSQPVGTLWSILFDLQGNPRVEKDALNKNFLIIDIGFGTTDFVVLSASMGIDESRSGTVDIAMQDYIKDLYRAIEIEIPQSKLTNAKITPLQLDTALINSDILDISTGKFNVAEIKKDLQLEFALKLQQRINTFGYVFDEFHEIILTGGGSIIMEKAIKQVFNNNNKIKLAKDPILANVTGFYIMAKQIYGE